MDMSPQRVRSAEFRTIRKGADPDEVRVFLNDVADELERAQNQSTAMEARARAAVARLQEVGDANPPVTTAPTPVEASADEAEIISRTLLLAQRTADTTVAEARSEATRIVATANDEAATTLDSTRVMAAQLLDEARSGARQAGEAERVAIAGEVEALKARRDFLESDVEQLEIFLVDQRNRVRDAATSLLDVADRVPGGLGDVRAPLLSASDDRAGAGDTQPDHATHSGGVDDTDPAGAAVPGRHDAGDDLLIVTDLADDEPARDEPSAADAGSEPSDAMPAPVFDDESDASAWSDQRDEQDAGRDVSDEPTAAMPVIETTRSSDDSDGFRFSFDDERS